MTHVRVGGVHHLALGALDVEALARFYELALGLVRSRVHLDESGQLRSIWLQLDPRGLEYGVLMVEKSSKNEDVEQLLGVAPGWFLSTFRIDSQQRVAVEQQIEAAGACIESRTQYSSYARDPEGNRFAISCYPLS